jgi:hypothetical protein
MYSAFVTLRMFQLFLRAEILASLVEESLVNPEA